MVADIQTNTLAKGLLIIEYVANEGSPNGVTLNQVVSAMEINKSSAYRHLMVMCELGWLERDEETFRYRIGAKLLQATSASICQFDLRTIARPILEKLAKENSLTAHLATLQPPLIVYLDKIESHQIPIMRSSPGLTAPCHSTAVGKAMLATMSEHEIRKMLPETLEKFTPNTIGKLDELVQNLEQARRNGGASEMEENEIGVGCVGAPIFRFDNKMIAAISLSGHAHLFTEGQKAELCEKVVKGAKMISAEMGCVSPERLW